MRDTATVKSLRLEVANAMLRLQVLRLDCSSCSGTANKPPPVSPLPTPSPSLLRTSSISGSRVGLLLPRLPFLMPSQARYTSPSAGNRLHMEQLLTRLAGTDETLDRRLLSLETALRRQLTDIENEQRHAATAWIIPFSSLAVALVVLGLWGCRQFCRVRKLHAF